MGHITVEATSRSKTSNWCQGRELIEHYAGSFTLETDQMFSAHTTPEENKNHEIQTSHLTLQTSHWVCYIFSKTVRGKHSGSSAVLLSVYCSKPASRFVSVE